MKCYHNPSLLDLDIQATLRYATAADAAHKINMSMCCEIRPKQRLIFCSSAPHSSVFVLCMLYWLYWPALLMVSLLKHTLLYLPPRY